MNKQNIIDFLLSVGFTVNLDEEGFIFEIIDNSSGKKLQQVPGITGIFRTFESDDKKYCIQFSNGNIYI